MRLESAATEVASMLERAWASFGPYRLGPISADKILEDLATAEQQKLEGQVALCEVLEVGCGVAAAVWAICHKESFTGGSLTQLSVALQPQDPQARNFVAEQLALFVPRIPGDVHLECCDAYAPIFPALLRAGLFMESIKLVGLVDEGMDYFRERPVARPEGFEVERALTSRVEEIVDIYRAAYEKKYGWFLNSQDFLNKKRQDLYRSLGESIAGKDKHWLVLRGGRAVGYCHVSLHDYGNGIGGVEPVLLPAARGCGVGTFLYQEALRLLAQENQRAYVGNTSHPMVMRLAVKLGRRRVATGFRKEHFFETRHFDLNTWK